MEIVLGIVGLILLLAFGAGGKDSSRYRLETRTYSGFGSAGAGNTGTYASEADAIDRAIKWVSGGPRRGARVVDQRQNHAVIWQQGWR